MVPLLTLEGVSYSYHSKYGETCALSDVSFQVWRGEFLAVVGPSGCGKSTLLSLISGLCQPEQGLISAADSGADTQKKSIPSRKTRHVSGKRNRTGTRTQTIGYMLQKDHLLEWRTVFRNVTLGLEIQHRLDTESLVRTEKMLKDYGLYPFRDSRPSELSGGMRQRAALIRTLAPQPELLLLDEPFSALDFQTRLSVCDDVASILRREKKTAVLVTHDLSEAISMADRILVLSKRPARIRSILEIRFAQDGMTPFERRNAPEFKDYFHILCEELELNV